MCEIILKLGRHEILVECKYSIFPTKACFDVGNAGSKRFRILTARLIPNYYKFRNEYVAMDFFVIEHFFLETWRIFNILCYVQ